MNKPTKAEMRSLIESYGRKILAQRHGARLKDQERVHGVFTRKLERLQAKYPELLRVLSDEFFTGLERAAERWLSQRIATGAACDY